MNWTLVICITASICIGFVAGVILSRIVVNEVRSLEQRTHNAFQAVANDVQNIHNRVTTAEEALFPKEDPKAESKLIH